MHVISYCLPSDVVVSGSDPIGGGRGVCLLLGALLRGGRTDAGVPSLPAVTFAPLLRDGPQPPQALHLRPLLHWRVRPRAHRQAEPRVRRLLQRLPRRRRGHRLQVLLCLHTEGGTVSPQKETLGSARIRGFWSGEIGDASYKNVLIHYSLLSNI